MINGKNGMISGGPRMNHEELDKLGISGIGQAKKSTQAVGNFQLNQLKLVGFFGFNDYS